MNIDQYIHLRSYKSKQILFITVVLAVLSWIILNLTNYLIAHKLIPDYITSSPEPIRVVAFFYVLILGYILIESLWRSFRSFYRRNQTYKFRRQDWPDKWIFNGATEPISNSELFIKSSRAGCLLERFIWKDFRMTFELKFLDNLLKHTGIIFRAADLDNYFMLEILQDSPHHGSKLDGNRSGIKSHVRYKGGWEIMYLEEKRDFDFSDFVEVVLEVKENTAYLYSKGSLIFTWILPTHVDVNHIEAGVKQNNITESTAKTATEVVQQIWFKKEYGMIGFRGHPGHGAIIRGLKIVPL